MIQAIAGSQIPSRASERVLLGRTGFSVSRICFGTSPLADMPQSYGYRVDDDRATATLKAMFAGPINFMDTSPVYGRGKSERDIGNVLREIGGLPKGYVLATKLDRDLDTGVFDGDVARRSLEVSLESLGIDRVQLLHLHDPEFALSLADVTRPGGALATLFRMKEEGLADAVGLAAGTVGVMTPMLHDWDFDVMLTHNRFTLINRNADEMIDLAVSRGMAVLNAAPYGSGILAKGAANATRYAYREAPEAVVAKVCAVEAVCRAHDVPIGAAALQFSLRDPRITSTVIGITRPERIQETIAWADLPIPDAVWDELAALPFSRDDPRP